MATAVRSQQDQIGQGAMSLPHNRKGHTMANGNDNGNGRIVVPRVQVGNVAATVFANDRDGQNGKPPWIAYNISLSKVFTNAHGKSEFRAVSLDANEAAYALALIPGAIVHISNLKTRDNIQAQQNATNALLQNGNTQDMSAMPEVPVTQESTATI